MEKKVGKFSGHDQKERTSCISKYVLNKLIQNGWMVKLYYRENDGFCCGGISKPGMKSLQIDIQKKKRVKISAKLIRNFKQAYDEIDAKIFGNPFSLLSLKTPDFVEAFNRSFSTFLVGNSRVN